jgi:hypothetical protein
MISLLRAWPHHQLEADESPPMSNADKRLLVFTIHQATRGFARFDREVAVKRE